MSRRPVFNAEPVMPANEEAEQALLGAILSNNAALEGIASFLKPEHFFVPAHGRIYERCVALNSEGRVADPITLRRRFETDGDLAEVGGAEYLADLASSIVSVVAAVDYGKVIADLAARRELIAAAQELMDEAYRADANEQDTATLLAEAEERISAIKVPGMNGRKMRSMGEIMGDVRSYWDDVKGKKVVPVYTGIADLDKILGGMLGGDLVMIGGRPGMGKSTLLRTIAVNKARRDDVVLIFSPEMSAEQVGMTMIQQTTAIGLAAQRTATMDNPDFARAMATSFEVGRLPIFVDDAPAITVPHMRRETLQLMRRLGRKPSIVGVDYLQLMKGVGRFSNRNEEVSQISRDLKIFAKEMDVPAVALVQLKRPEMGREEKRPTLSDMRESGSLEADADAVVLVHREEYYHLKKMPTESSIGGPGRLDEWAARLREIRGLADLIVAKVRSNKEGVVQVSFDGRRSLFSDHAVRYEDDVPSGPRDLLDLEDEA